MSWVLPHLRGLWSFRGWVCLTPTHLSVSWAASLCACSDYMDWNMNFVSQNNIIILCIKKISQTACNTYNSTTSSPASQLPHSKIYFVLNVCFLQILHINSANTLLNFKENFRTQTVKKWNSVSKKMFEFRENTSTLFLICLNNVNFILFVYMA